jgi:hypothetical protein
MATTKRFENVGFKLSENLVDVSYETQERTARLGESYLKAFQEAQKSRFDMALTWMKRLQELQMLSFEYFQESVRAGNETLSSFMRVQDEVRTDVKNRFDHQVTELERVAKATK